LRHAASITKTARRLQAAGALAALALVVVVALGMHRGILLGSDIKSRCWPWAGVLPPASLQAPALSDPVWQFIPWLRLARSELLAGRLPLWNPHQDGGVPLLGNSISALGSPLVWPALLLGIDPGWNLSLLIRILLAAATSFLWLRELGRSATAAALGAIAFALSGPFVAWLEHPQTLVVAGVPLLLLAARQAARGRGRVAAVAGATFLVLSGGHPETQLMAALIAAAVVMREALRQRDARSLLAPAGGAILGLGLAAPLLFSFFEYYRRSAARLGQGRQPFTLAPVDLLRYVLPSVPGSNVIEAAAAVSIVLLALVPLGLALTRDGEIRFWAALGAAMLVTTYTNPISQALATAMPVHWTRFLLFVPLALAVVGSAGLDACRDRIAARGRPHSAAGLGILLAVLTLVELVLRARGVHAVTSPEAATPIAPILEVLRKDHGIFRILPFHTFLPPNSATDYGLDDVRGYDAISSQGWRLARQEIGRFDRTPTTADGIEPADLAPGGRALAFWNVQYLLVDPRFRFSVEEWNTQRGLDLEEIYSGPDGRILLNRRAMPRARLSVPGTVTVQRRVPTRWNLQIETSAAGLFLLADPFFPGWHASVDGNDVALSLRPGEPIAFPVPAGRHGVQVDYRPAWLGWSTAVFVISALSLAVLAGRRRSGPSLEAF
jgi:hypothetical protein